MGEKPTAVDAEEAGRAAKERDDKQQAAIAIGEEGVQRAAPERGTEQARQAGSMPAIQNIRAREAAPPAGSAASEGDPIPDIGSASPAAATNLNSSKSNTAREAPAGDAPADEAGAIYQRNQTDLN